MSATDMIYKIIDREPGKRSAGERPGEPGSPESAAVGGSREAGAAGGILCPRGEGHEKPAGGKRKRRCPEQ